MSSIKLVSINIELDKHLARVRGFLEKERADVVCLQEVYESDLEQFAKDFDMEMAFAQMSLIGRGGYYELTKPPYFPYGIGILSVLPLQDIQRVYYRGSEHEAKKHEFTGTSRDGSHVLLYASIEKDKEIFTVGTTHLTWTPNGAADDLQRSDLKSLLAFLKNIPEIVLCGDFNGPRGREIFDTIARYYKDSIPSQYTTSIDADLHRDGDKVRKPLMVDGLFTTRHYQAKNVRLQDGVSDHMAIVAEIHRTKDI